MQFDSLGLSEPLLRAVASAGYRTPTAIQASAIPEILSGKDIMAAAQTGTGKTAAFTLPLLQQIAGNMPAGSRRTRALVLTPTRELAAQVEKSIRTYSKFLKIRAAVVFGGVGIGPQISKLKRGVDILVATPGRLLDLHERGAIAFDSLEFFVLDEADRMLDMGFIHDIKTIMSLLPKHRQNLMFSATFSDDIRQLAKRIVDAPIEIDVAPRNSTVDRISQVAHPVDKAKKVSLLAHLIQAGGWHQVLVFSRTKHGADNLVRKLAKQDIRAAAIHGNKSQAQRTKVLADFKRNKIQVLVATDIASRGLDIAGLDHVVNFDLPGIAEDYVHRIGRTGRAGEDGHAISLVTADEVKQLRAIERLIKKPLAREIVDGFEPERTVPESQSGKPTRRAKGPRAQKSGDFRRRRSNGSRKPRGKSGNPTAATAKRKAKSRKASS